MSVLQAKRWLVALRWADGERSTVVYEGPLWVGKVTQAVHVLAQAEHRRRRQAEPELPAQLEYEIRSFKPAQDSSEGA
ncbi:hypothetical protein E7T06_15295 [Deinococcus sp. Arct2-2]|uniref:hypothetical protein n=1 Tax=Deinococcus sp. Arct2-2 TaxID=2568653 RepID=UPI0010A3E3DF|nr:hypothetical protein [Deinococcus sp. Arct2-2]THF68727.1 hypothetical protein E7T06_15295 [Deinococcus sp. Arct2-2]